MQIPFKHNPFSHQGKIFSAFSYNSDGNLNAEIAIVHFCWNSLQYIISALIEVNNNLSLSM